MVANVLVHAGGCVRVSAELCGSYQQPSKQLTCSFPTKGQIQLNLLGTKFLLSVITVNFASHGTGLEQDLAFR